MGLGNRNDMASCRWRETVMAAATRGRARRGGQ
jgi:hypothetical protein